MPPPRPDQQQTNGWAVAGVILVIVLIISSLGRCNNRGIVSNGTTTMNTSGVMGNGMSGQPRQPPEALSADSVARGAAHVRVAMREEGALGAQIYSQNCYDALSRAFSWGKLDACGAFDMVAIRRLASSDASALTQADWFDSEVAAGRYLGAATAGGRDPSQADQRLSELQARAARVAPAPSPPPVAEAAPDEAGEPDPDASSNVASNAEAPVQSVEDLDPVDE